MAEYQIMYWKDIPVQVKAADATHEISVQLPRRFQEAIDAIAMQEGLTQSEDYLAGWHWGEMLVIPGTAEEVARSVAEELQAQYPKQPEEIVHYVLRVRED